MWIPKEIKNPVVKQEPTRHKISVFGSVNISNGRLVYHTSAIFNANTFLEHLEQILQFRTKSKKILLILDNARYHHAKIILPWLEKNKRKIELFFLPPYSPELNPIERVWGKTRYSETHNRFFPTLDSLLNSITQCLNRWTIPNGELKSLCAINYAV